MVGGVLRVLLGEDNPANADLFSDALASDGHLVVHEWDGLQAYERALAERFDVIFLDMEMPGLRGDEVCQRLRAAGMRVPIVALSSSALPDQVQRGLSAGFDRYLTKPIAPRSLRQVVRELSATSG